MVYKNFRWSIRNSGENATVANKHWGLPIRTWGCQKDLGVVNEKWQVAEKSEGRQLEKAVTKPLWKPQARDMQYNGKNVEFFATKSPGIFSH